MVVPSFEAFEKELGQPEDLGYSLQQLCDVALRYGAWAAPVQTDLQTLEQLPRPFTCIALLRTSHFVVVQGIHDGSVDVIDPPESYPMRRGLFEALWTGNALLIARSELELPKKSAWSRGLIGILLTVPTVSAVILLLARRAARRQGTHQ